MDVAKMDDAESEQVSDEAKMRMVEGLRAGLRALDRKSAKPASETWEDILAAGATSIADIDKVVGELLFARDYLQSEGERVRQVNVRYADLARTASASVMIISESLGKWRNSETIGPARAPSLAPVDDA